MDNETQKLARQLTDDRKDSDLLVFEKTWGHRLLAGVCVAMLVVAFVFVAYCVYGLASMSALGLENLRFTYGYSLYTTGIVTGVMLIPPAVLGIYVAKHPKWATLTLAAAVFAVAILIGIAVYASTLPGINMLPLMLYLGVASVFPIIYFVAALKVKHSQKEQ